MSARLRRERPPAWQTGSGRRTTLLGAPAVRTCSKVGDDKAMQVCVTKPRDPGKAPVVVNAFEVCRLLRNARYRDRESFYAVALNARNEVLGVEEVARGTVNGVDVHPRELFKSSLILGASAIVLAHNHPSGATRPSNEDIELTKRAREVGRLIGVPVLDHIIVGGTTGCHSIAESHPSALEGIKHRVRARRRKR